MTTLMNSHEDDVETEGLRSWGDPFAGIDAHGHRVRVGTMHGPDGVAELTVILGYDELREAARDWRTFSSDAPAQIPIPHETSVRTYAQLPLECDPPAHTRYRAMVAPALERARVERFGPDIAAFASTTMEPSLRSGRGEVVEGWAVPIFTRAISLVLERPQDEERWRTWGKMVYTAEGANPDFDAYLDEVLDEIERTPGTDAFGRLARERIDGRALSTDELRGLIALMLAAGRDTTVDAVAGALFHLARTPSVWGRIVDEPGVVGSAVDELLRYVTPLPQIGRRVTRDSTLAGVRVAQGSWVSLAYRFANHDARAFPDPSACVVDRAPNRHVAFGHGPHTCVGMHVAHVVIRSVLQVLRERAPRLQVVEPVGFEPWIDLGFDHIPHGFARLELALAQ
ncbi:MAG TPA: cytochrome P450 [Actinomycetota bacterium]|nr:cytochrome P450 [Actinomycetota bacterium]